MVDTNDKALTTGLLGLSLFLVVSTAGGLATGYKIGRDAASSETSALSWREGWREGWNAAEKCCRDGLKPVPEPQPQPTPAPPRPPGLGAAAD